MKSYIYHHSPGYNSQELLIEFTNGVENKAFIPDLLDALKELNLKVMSKEDLWINGELIYNIHSDLGTFEFSIDNWGLAFIMAENNKHCIDRIDQLLVSDSRFTKIEVDYSTYKLK